MEGEVMNLRQEIHGCIDDISESKLVALKPLQFALADESIVIERDLMDRERFLIAQGMAEFERNPQDFVPLDSVN